jgi:hypothetical protein
MCETLAPQLVALFWEVLETLGIGSPGVGPWGCFVSGSFLSLFPVCYEVKKLLCYMLPAPRCSAQVCGAKEPWMEPSETEPKQIFLPGI